MSHHSDRLRRLRRQGRGRRDRRSWRGGLGCRARGGTGRVSANVQTSPEGHDLAVPIAKLDQQHAGTGAGRRRARPRRSSDSPQQDEALTEDARPACHPESRIDELVDLDPGDDAIAAGGATRGDVQEAGLELERPSRGRRRFPSRRRRRWRWRRRRLRRRRWFLRRVRVFRLRGRVCVEDRADGRVVRVQRDVVSDEQGAPTQRRSGIPMPPRRSASPARRRARQDQRRSRPTRSGLRSRSRFRCRLGHTGG